MKRSDSELVKFSFIRKNNLETKGVKTLKLFRSWFRLMKNRNRISYGFVRFADGETWIWQASEHVYNAGWKKAKSARQ